MELFDVFMETDKKSLTERFSGSGYNNRKISTNRCRCASVIEEIDHKRENLRLWEIREHNEVQGGILKTIFTRLGILKRFFFIKQTITS